MAKRKSKKAFIVLMILFLSVLNGNSQPTCTWHPDKKEMEFSLEHLSGILNCDINGRNGKSHHFSKVIHKPNGLMISPDDARMKRTGMLNFFRVLVEGGYLTELRVTEAQLKPEDDGITMIFPPSIRLQAKIKVKFTFKEPNIIDMDLWVETLTNYPKFEILLSAYLAPGFESGVYVAKKEFGPIEAEQIRLTDQPMIHGIWPFFPRDEAGANLLTDGRHQKGRWFWRMAIGRRYGIPLAFFSNDGVDAILMGKPDDVYAVGATYKGEASDNVADHRSLYLSLFGEDFKAGEGRHTQMRMIIGDFGSVPEKHQELYQTFINEVKAIPRSFQINPEVNKNK
ncbi:MAG: hypothetical protein R3182_01795 [Draconibacterium sp.]|nr:hypothetical protein [Draconibacterium sp.]